VPQKPVLIIHPTPLGQIDVLARDLFDGFWFPPSSDRGLIRIGIIPSRKTVRFRALQRTRIFVFSHKETWEVASPEGVIWTAEVLSLSRPGIVTYFSAVKNALKKGGNQLSSSEVHFWKKLGFHGARWIGPPNHENPQENLQKNLTSKTSLERWFLSVTPPTGKEQAREICKKIQNRFKSSCEVISRVELPPIGRGILRAENSNFAKEFEGVLEIISPYGPVEIFDVIIEERKNETSSEKYGPRLFIVPGTELDLSLTQTTSLTNYLEGVLPAEIFPNAPMEALRAQAIVARTYAIRHVRSEESLRPYSICASTNCQAYRGIPYKQERTSQAVYETSDFVLKDSKGELSETFYHSICGGHTESRIEVWGPPPLPYLAGISDQINNRKFDPMKTQEQVKTYLEDVPTAYCGIASLTKRDRWRWTQSLDQNAVENILLRTGLSPPLVDIEIQKRGISGRVFALKLKTGNDSKVVYGEFTIRQLLGGLLSSLFAIEPESKDGKINSLLIHGGGSGHGVGLCQMGAIGRAEQGQTFREILTAYYPGTILAPLVEPMLP